ncbi:MAG: tetratricopeptide repeat protein [Bacteroidaceae bacterium]|nr:tetratricopeptide repeat protein [Bacteroidaceae bacterium]
MKSLAYKFTWLLLLWQLAALTAVAQPSASSNTKVDFLYLEAQRLMLSRNLDAAYELLRYCKELNPNHPAVLYSLSLFNLSLQHDSVATADMTRAVELVPDNYWYQDLLVKAHFAGHRPEAGIKALERINSRWSDKTEPLYMLIDAYASQNMADSLLSALERLEVKEGKSDQITLEKVQVFVQRGEVKPMLDELLELLKANPKTDLPASLLPRLLSKKEDAFTLLGDMYHEIGNDERAFQYYDSCLVYNPESAMVLNNYAYYLALWQRDLDTAERMSRRSNELDPNNPTYLDTLAWVLFQQGRYAEAKEVMDRAVSLMKPEDLDDASDVKDHIQQINEKVNAPLP